MNKIKNNELVLYNKILFLSRNKLFYTKLPLTDSFHNRVYLIFFHISFLLIKLKLQKENLILKDFSQKLFDLTFKQIEINMRENGFGDVTINKNMKFLVKQFYSLLFKCENYDSLTLNSKNLLFSKFLTYKSNYNDTNNAGIIDYFDKYKSFCFDLSPDSVLDDILNFKY
jgi:hypothetical protein